MPPLYCTCIVKKGEKDVLDRVVGMWTHNRSLVPTHTLMYANTHKYMQSYIHTQSHTHTHTQHTHTHTHTHTAHTHMHTTCTQHAHTHTQHTHTHTQHTHTHTHTHSPVDILHVNSAMVNGCMWLHMFWPTVAMVVGDPLVCSPGEHVRPLQKHEALLVLHTAVVDFKHRCGAGVLMGMMSQLHHISF